MEQDQTDTVELKQSPRARAWNVLSKVAQFISGEWILDKRPNGGDAILARSLWVTSLAYVGAFLLRQGADCFQYAATTTGIVCRVSLAKFALDIRETLAWPAAIFGAVYLALYSRFAAQWTYIANLFNQIKNAEVRAAERGHDRRVQERLASWKAAFLEDTYALHLTSKPMFAMTVYIWGKDETVKRQFIDTTVGKEKQFEIIMARAKSGLTHARRTVEKCPESAWSKLRRAWHTRYGSPKSVDESSPRSK